ncbi:MAG: cytidine deaminase [Bacteroidetes bacterium]|jgi:cytidine deaminase|nr:cytidine deaminase [Bacteroidota bacterium]
MEIRRESLVRVTSEADLSERESNLIEQARIAADNAYAPYSEFHVGTALKLSDGEIVLGNNQENAAYPSGLCAERVAIFAAKANHPNKSIDEVMIVVKTDKALKQGFTPPCGSCLQVLWDVQNRQNSPIKIHVQSPDKTLYSVDNVNQFLPFGFEL